MNWLCVKTTSQMGSESFILSPSYSLGPTCLFGSGEQCFEGLKMRLLKSYLSQRSFPQCSGWFLWCVSWQLGVEEFLSKFPKQVILWSSAYWALLISHWFQTQIPLPNRSLPSSKQTKGKQLDRLDLFILGQVAPKPFQLLRYMFFSPFCTIQLDTNRRPLRCQNQR